MNRFKTLQRESILTHSWMHVERHRVCAPNGQCIDDWLYLSGPDCVLVLCRDKTDRFLVLRQHKYGLEQVTHGPVGGKIETNEIPEIAAQRELSEETGLQARAWTHLGEYVLEPNRFIGRSHLFLAEDLIPCDVRHSKPDLENPELVWITRQKLIQIVSSEATVASWALLFLLCLNHCEENPRNSQTDAKCSAEFPSQDES